MLCISCYFILVKPLTLRMDHAKVLDVLTSLPVSHAILPRVVCFATSRPANHAIIIREGDNDNCPRIGVSAHASFVFKIDSQKTQCLLIALNKMQLLKKIRLYVEVIF